MKLLVQLVFAQGYVWRDRFPEMFARAKCEQGKMWLIILPSALVASGIPLLKTSPVVGISFLAVGISWLVWFAVSTRIGEHARLKPLRLSLVWFAGFAFVTSLLCVLAVAPFLREWILVPWAIGLLMCFGSGWLRAFQYNYLLFRQPDEYAWVLEGLPQPPKGLMAAYAYAIGEIYWRLPKQILFPRKERHAQ